MNSAITIYPGSDSSTWPANGSLWKYIGDGNTIWNETFNDSPVSIRKGDLVFLAKVIYCTKSDITINIIIGEKVAIWMFPCYRWNEWFERLEQ